MCFIIALIASVVISEPNLRCRMAKEPLGTGTRIALDVNFPFNAGNALATAFPAPVSVITIFNAAALPLRFLLCILSTKFWSFVYA